jgi:hypothetical protein
MRNRRDLANGEVEWIVELHHEFNGVRRIAKITGIELERVRSIIRGKTYRDITGGRLANGKRPEAMWRHSTKSFEEIQQQQVTA